MEATNTSSPSDKKHRFILIGIIIVALILGVVAGVAGFMYFNGQQEDKPVLFEGTDYTGWSEEDIRADLDRKAKELQMSVSVAETVDLYGNNARLNFINDADNNFGQIFKVQQNGSVLYESGVVEPGNGVEWVTIDGLKEGEAEVIVNAVDAEGTVSGNSTVLVVNIESVSN